MPKRIQTNVKVLIKAQRYYITQKTKCNNHLTKNINMIIYNKSESELSGP